MKGNVIRQRLKSNSGASLVAALLFFAFCAFAAAAVLLSASSGGAAWQNTGRARQAGYALRSAAGLLREDLALLGGGEALELSAAERVILWGCAAAEPPEDAVFLGKDCGHTEAICYEGFAFAGIPEDALLAGPLRRGMEALAAAYSRWDGVSGLMGTPFPAESGPYRESFTIELPGDPRFSGGCTVTAAFAMALSGEAAGSWEIELSAPDTGLRLLLSAPGVLTDGENRGLPGPVCTLHYGRGEPGAPDWEEFEIEAPSTGTEHTLSVRWNWEEITIARRRQG